VKRARFIRDARLELTASRTWYGVKSREVARDFTTSVERTVTRIRELPHSAPRWPGIDDEDVRRIVVPDFPYLVVYLVTDDEIIILAVAHTRRRPGYWRERVRKAARDAARRRRRS
jgi:plasmid stabilization system protein ParE